MAGNANAPIGLADLAVGLARVADDLLELEPSGILVIAQDLHDIGGRLIAQIEPVGEAASARTRRTVARYGRHQPFIQLKIALEKKRPVAPLGTWAKLCQLLYGVERA